jgi:hypothetical protein
MQPRWAPALASDGWGGFLTNTVDVTVTAGGVYLAGTPRMANTNFTISFAGIPGLTYTLEWAEAVNGSWTKLGNYTASTTAPGIGLFNLTDPIQPGHPSRFYRTVYPSY